MKAQGVGLKGVGVGQVRSETTQMATTPRRARERANTRERIIEAALSALESEGAPALTIRRIAADVEYTPPVVYQHLASKDALVAELVEHRYGLMRAALEPALSEPDIDLRLRQVAARYVRFADEHPHLYEAMNGNALPPQERRRAAEAVYQVLLNLLSTWATTHEVTLPSQTDACEILWGTLYGIASIGTHAEIGSERAQRLAQEAVGAILRGWEAE